MKVIRDDCRNVMRELGDRSFDHVITDPPYSPTVHNNGRRRGLGGALRDGGTVEVRELGFDPLAEELREEVAMQITRIARRWILIFTDHEGGEAWRQDMTAAGAEFVRFGLWLKRGATPQFSGDRPGVGHEVIVICHAPRPKGSGRMRWNGGGRHAIWDVPIARKGEHERHTTEKPITLISALVRDFTDRGDSVLDPFAGSGTTLAACKRLGRAALGVEADTRWARVANQRIRREREQPDLVEYLRQPREQLKLDTGAAGAGAAQGELLRESKGR